MENNLSQKAEAVLSRKKVLVEQKPKAVSLPPIPHKSFFKKRIFIILVLIVLLTILGTIFSLLNVSMFKKEVPYEKKIMSPEEYSAMIESLKNDGFFNVPTVTPEKLEKIQDSYESAGYMVDQPPRSAADRQKALQDNGTVGVVQEN